MNNRQTKTSDDLIFGIRAVMEAVRKGKDVDKVLVKRGLKGDLINELLVELKTHKVPVQYVPDEKLNRVTKKNHQGVIAFISPISFSDVEEIIARSFDNGKIPFFIALDEVSDVRNFGAIVRSAECAGATAVIIPEKGSARIGADAVKTSAGALHHMPVCRVKSLKKTIQFMQQCGISVFGATEKASEHYYKHDLSIPCCIVMGAEDTGLSNEVMRTIDHMVGIPIQGEIGSLNVSVAASVLMYEVVRQRMLE